MRWHIQRKGAVNRSRNCRWKIPILLWNADVMWPMIDRDIKKRWQRNLINLHKLAGLPNWASLTLQSIKTTLQNTTNMVDRPQVLYMPAYAMTVPYGQFTNLSPAQKLSYSADFPAEILFHQKPTRAADVVNLFRVHHTDPMHVQRATLSHRHIARRPNRAKRPLNSWMGFRSE